MNIEQFTISGEQEHIESLLLQNKRLIRLRWFYISLLPLTGSLASYFADDTPSAQRYFLIGVGGLMFNCFVYLLANLKWGKVGYFQMLMVFQLAVDLSIATLVTYMTGGPASRATAVFIVPILATGLIFSSRIVYLVALMCGAAYVFSIIAYNLTHDAPLYLTSLLVPAVFYPVFYLVMAQLVHYLIRTANEETREKAYDSFLALLSHQLKHPLSATNAIIDQLDHEVGQQLPPKQKRYINMLKSENRSLSILLNNLLETAAPSSRVGKHDEVELPKILQDVSYYSAEKSGRVKDLRLELSDISMKVVGSSERLKTALTNILSNAFLYSEGGTPVTVRLERVKDENAIIIITDEGSGIGKDARKKLFDRFAMGKPSIEGVQGLGLGLSVAKKIVEAHYGSMHVVSDKSGTKVIIILKKGVKDD